MSSPSPSPAQGAQPASATPQPLADWFCPACRGERSAQPGNCPRCGTALERGLLSGKTDTQTPELRSMLRRLWVSLLLGFPLIALAVLDADMSGKLIRSAMGRDEFLFLQAGLATVLVFYCAGPVLARGWKSLRTRRLTVDTLLALGIGAAYLYSLAAGGYIVYGVDPLTRYPGVPDLSPELRAIVQFIAPFQEGTLDPFFAPTALLVCFALIGQVFELRTREQSASALLKLAPLAPKAARIVLSNGSEEDRAANLVKPGELVRVRAGERIPVDGVIREGVTTIDESMLTGEATRAERGPGGRVLAGSENGLRPITVEATRVGSDTLIDQVIGLIGQAQTRRAAFQRATDRLVAWYLPIILLVAVATFAAWLIVGEGDSAFTYAAVCAVAVFVVACPCAVGLATSAATVIGMRRAAQAGILFRDAASLERLVAVDTVLLDKTGTLTEGKPKLAGIVPNSGISEAAVLAMAAAVERGSEHPLALAIVWEAFRRGLEIAPAEGVEAVVGKGIRGQVGGQRVSVGRLGFLQESGVYTELMLSEAQAQRHRGHVVVFVGEGKRCVGLVVMNDPLRAGTRAALDQLRTAGMRLVLLTGDHAETANGLARNVAISEVVADALPVEKFAVVQKFKGEGRVVAMCGDGVNDAPALVAADVGIALGSGTGAAIGTAGVTLVQSDLRALSTARELSRAVVRTIRQNLILAFAFNVLAIPIAAGALIPLGGGLINSVWATTAMSIGSLVVLANSLRLALRPLNVPSPEPTSATGDNASKK